jgi:integrase
MLNQQTDRRRIRRALSPEAAARLIQAAETGPVVMGMDGESRAILYALMLAAGVRKSEAGSLTPESFALDGDPATVTILASYSKHRRDDVLPLPSGLAARLARWLTGKAPDRPVFALPDKPHKMFYRDLRRAGVERETASGVIDLHGLRHTFVSDVVASGATVKTARELARHSTRTSRSTSMLMPGCMMSLRPLSDSPTRFHPSQRGPWPQRGPILRRRAVTTWQRMGSARETVWGRISRLLT